MPSWLTTADLWAHLEGPGDEPEPETSAGQRLSDALNAAMELVDERTSTDWDDEDDLPARVRLAALLQAGRLFKRGSAPFGIAAVGSVEGGQAMRLSARLDPDVEALIADYTSYAAL